jgi:hypothetical protein
MRMLLQGPEKRDKSGLVFRRELQPEHMARDGALRNAWPLPTTGDVAGPKPVSVKHLFETRAIMQIMAAIPNTSQGRNFV